MLTPRQGSPANATSVNYSWSFAVLELIGGGVEFFRPS
jgi:hypothetical protein